MGIPTRTGEPHSKQHGALAVWAVVILLFVTATFMATASPSSRAAVTITAGPYLQNASMGGMTITWETNATGSSEVDYGPTTSYGNHTASPGQARFHSVTVTGLKANTTYHYRVKTGDTYSYDRVLRTAPQAQDSLRFYAYGDTRTNETAHRSVVARMNVSSPQMAIHVGDLVADGTSQSDWDSYFRALYGFNDHVPMYPCIGNHEQAQSPSTLYFHYYPFLNGARWYSFDYGPVHFIALDTTSDMSVGGAQYTWLVKDLAGADHAPRWKVVFFHHPPYSSVGSNMNVRDNFGPLFEKYHVDIVFSGHNHNYEHAKVNGIDYIVTGGGGAPLSNTGYSNWTVYTERTFEFVRVEMSADKATLEAVRPDGSTFDKFALDRKDLKAPDPVPLTVTNLGTGGAVSLDWAGHGAAEEWDIVGYEVYMSKTGFSDVNGMTPVRTFKAGTYRTDIAGLQSSVTYNFAVVAIDGHSNKNTTVNPTKCIPTDSTPPAKPQNLEIRAATATSFNLSWKANSEPDLAGYKVWMNATPTNTNYTFKLKDNTTVQLVNNITMVKGLAPKTNYCFAVQAIDNATPPNPSPLSNSICGLTLEATKNPTPNNAAFLLICISVLVLVIVLIAVVAFYLYRSSGQQPSGQYPSVQYQQHQPAYQRQPVPRPQVRPAPHPTQVPKPPPAKKFSLDIPDSTGEGKVLVPKDLPAEPAGAAQASHRAAKRQDPDVMIIEEVEPVDTKEKDK